MWIVQVKESKKWKTIVTNISEERFADEWITAYTRNSNKTYRKRHITRPRSQENGNETRI